MKNFWRHIIALALLSILNLPLSILQAQGISVQAPKSVLLGDEFSVTFIVDNDAAAFKAPSFKGFSLRAGPFTSQSKGSFIVNGKRSVSVETSFSYTLSADREGTFTIGAASCNAAGKTLTSEPFTVKVEKPTAAQLQQRQQQQQQQRQRQQRAAIDPFGFFDDDLFGFDPWGGQGRQQQAAPTIDEKNLFARATVSKSNPWQGEQLTVTYKIYTRLALRQFSIDKKPGNKGFWVEDLTPTNGHVKESVETVGGERYKVYEVRSVALFPQESGRLTVAPLDITVQIVHQTNPFYPAQLVEHTLHTAPVNIDVKSLPPAPEGFSGAVSRDLKVSGGLTNDSVKGGEAVTYSLTVSGTGNLMLINPEQPQFPETFEVFEPQIKDKITHGAGGVGGSRTFEWVLIPNKGGHYTLPPYTFVWFDPAKGDYRTFTVDSQQVTVVGDSENAKPGNEKQETEKPGTEKRWTLYLLYVLSGLALLFIVVAIVRWIIKRWRSREVDHEAQRKQGALRLARRRLKKSASYLEAGEAEPFYQEVYRALWGCLSDKYGIPTSQLSRETVASCLAEKQVPEEKQESILQLLNEVDLARFAPGNPETQMQHVYQQALNVISEI